MSSKKLKLNLEHQITANDANREEDLIDNIDPSSSSSEDNDIDHEEDSCRTRVNSKRHYLEINFFTFRFPVGKLRKINQN